MTQTAIRQVWFTWAERGLDGANCAQVVAASDGLQQRGDPERDRAVDLCTFPGVPSDAPPRGWRSVGWLTTRGGRRFAFHKVGNGQDGAGRHGNVAHQILIGDRVDLPAAWLVARFLEDVWWTGEAVESETPPDRLQETGTAYGLPLEPAALTSGLARVLTANGAIHGFVDRPADAEGVLAVLADVVPDLLDASAVSTYETLVRSRPFTLVGVVAGKQVLANPSRPALEVARYLVSASAEQRRRIASLLTSSRASWADLVPKLLPFALADSGGGIGWRRLRELAGTPELARELMVGKDARAALVEGLREGSTEANALLLKVLADQDPAIVRAVAQSAGAFGLETGSGWLLAKVVRFGPHAIEGVADAVLTGSHPLSPSQAAQVPLPVLAAALGRRGRMPGDQRQELLASAIDQLRRQSFDGTFGDAWVEVLELARARGLWTLCAHLVCGSRDALFAAKYTFSAADWVDVASAAGVEDAVELLRPDSLDAMPREVLGPVYWSAVAHAGEPVGWGALRPAARFHTPPEHIGTARAMVESRARLELLDPASALRIPQLAASLATSNDPYLQMWHRLASASPRLSLRHVVALAESIPHDSRVEAAWFITRLLTHGTTDPEILRWLLPWSLSHVTPEVLAIVLMRVAQRGVLARDDRAVRAALWLTCDLVHEKYLGLARIAVSSARLSDKTLQRAWEEVVATPGLAMSPMHHSDIVPDWSVGTRRWLADLFPVARPGRGQGWV